MSLEWPQVSFDHQKRTVEIRLASEATKTEEERVAVMGEDLYEVLAAWDKHREFYRDNRMLFGSCFFRQGKAKHTLNV